MRILVAGGGTAGHVYPGLSLARVLRDRGHDVSFLGTERGLEASIVPAAGFAFDAIRAKPLARKLSLGTALAPFVALAAVRRCRSLVRGADVTVGMGGYVSVPAVLAARRERIPVVLHEQNAVPGLANRVLARTAKAVALSFAEAGPAFPRRTRLVSTGNPVREEILAVPAEREGLAKEGRKELDLDPDRRTVVVFGGSQGALHVDRAAIGACFLLRRRTDLQVVLITGPAHLAAVRRALPDEPGGLIVRLFGYVERMELAYACAALVVSRAGATTVAELTTCGLPALLVPYPHATGRHQEANARAMERAGGAVVMADDQVSAQTLAERITALLDDGPGLAAMAERSAAFGSPEAAPRLADLVTEVGS
jgi:UDP-N-acetylglucosamine--N-acetylmuramyl-(pentapeptide) pyrophosphoryl-undecaprenol N-acetylglucosamine transferase